MDKYFTVKAMDWRQVVAIIIPLLVDQAFVIGLSLLNTAMISSSGVAAVSAVNMVDSLNMFLINVFIAVATGGTVIVAQYKGVDNMNMVSRSATQAVSSVFMLAVGLGGLLAIFHTPVLNLLFGGAEATVMENASIYMVGSCLSYPGVAVVQAAMGDLRGVGDTKASLAMSLVMNLSYVALNLILVTFMGMGVTGFVISMNVSRYAAAICSIFYLSHHNHNIHFRLRDAVHLDFKIQKWMLTVGVPFAAEQMFFNGGKILTQTFMVQMGTLALTTNAISASITMLLQIAANALNLAVVTVVGQCMGRRDVEDARRITRSFIVLSMLTFVVSAVVVLPLFPLIVQLFAPPVEIVGDIFLITALCAIADPLLWSFGFIVPSALRAAGDAKFTSVAALISMWVVRVVLGYVLGVVFKLGIVGVWVAMFIEWGSRGLVFTLRFRGSKWCKHNLIGES
ncbi:MATE family efflux transporter [Gehongia tenuis]|uniref:Probable multidrug resistance protein NorM n=1 Tax=Gehongia tenuis TaxID=2763655 RepID=A0A926D5M2_9FIRM|nr:MATE family efflux transporter [Gehongia tenuis]